jgi:hypothetical protein
MPTTLAADPHYLPFVRSACKHQHTRVRRLARQILGAMATDIKDDIAPTKSVTELPTVPRGAEMRDSGSLSPRAGFSYRIGPMMRLQNAPRSTPLTDCDQNSNALDPVRFSHDRISNNPSGICCLYKTTTPEAADVRNSNRGASATELVYPERLTPEQREMAARELAAIPDDLRQAVLDELEGRVRAERQGAQPVYDALSYLRHVCDTAAADDFEANLGLTHGAGRSPPAPGGGAATQAGAARPPGCRTATSTLTITDPDMLKKGDPLDAQLFVRRS